MDRNGRGHWGLGEGGGILGNKFWEFQFPIAILFILLAMGIYGIFIGSHPTLEPDTIIEAALVLEAGQLLIAKIGLIIVKIIVVVAIFYFVDLADPLSFR